MPKTKLSPYERSIEQIAEAGITFTDYFAKQRFLNRFWHHVIKAQDMLELSRERKDASLLRDYSHHLDCAAAMVGDNGAGIEKSYIRT